MEHPSVPATVPGMDYFPPKLELLCSAAALVLNEHVNDATWVLSVALPGHASACSSPSTTWRSCDRP
ncbi:MAG: hypothetical protein ACRDTD_00275 [Pseudonocardiaceae bacterium]